jgi:A/G-specific adenine glycosylase
LKTEGRNKAADVIARQLSGWYETQKRRLPWRETRDPYPIWISEIMLQQTQVQTVIPYYERFLDTFPTVEVLARSALQDVLKAWENLGYYARARHVHEAANIITHQFGGQMPDRWDDIIRLPGIGSYTAGAILSIAFKKPVPAVDGNVRRVLSRLFAVKKPIDDPRTRRRLYELAERLVPEDSPDVFNQAMMELGALICKSGNPSCARCPLQTVCRAYEQGLQHRLPMTKKKGKLPHEHATAGILHDHRQRVLIVQRPARGLLGSLWKFPGGFTLPEETPAEGLRRTIQEELDLEIHASEWVTSVKHAFTHFRMTLHVFHCLHTGVEPRALTCQAWQWASLHDLETLPFSKADRKVISSI